MKQKAGNCIRTLKAEHLFDALLGVSCLNVLVCDDLRPPCGYVYILQPYIFILFIYSFIISGQCTLMNTYKNTQRPRLLSDLIIFGGLFLCWSILRMLLTNKLHIP